MESTSEGLLRRLGFLETLFASLHDHGCSQVVYALILKSENEIPSSAVEKSLQLLQRSFVHLQLTIVEHGESKYFKKMTEPTIDFEVLERDDWKTVYEAEMTAESILDPTVRLWRCKYLTMPKLNSSSTSFTSALVFRIHHSVTDGTTNMNILNTFHKILDSTIGGSDVQVEEKSGTFNFAAAEDLLPLTFKWNDVIEYCRMVWKEFFPYNSPFFAKFPQPESCELAKTRSVMYELTKEETSLLLQNCRRNKCTVNGALTSSGAIAMNSILSKKEGKDLTTTFQVEHDVNLRKYTKTNANYNGVMIGYHFQYLETKNEDFIWELARKSSTDLKQGLQDDRILQSARVMFQLSGYIDQMFDRQLSHSDFKVRSDFGTSNMGDVSKMFPGVGENVSVERLSRSTAWHLEGSPWNHCVTTFRGRLFYNLDYSVNCITDELAEEYASLTIDILKRRCIYETNILDDHF